MTALLISINVYPQADLNYYGDPTQNVQEATPESPEEAAKKRTQEAIQKSEKKFDLKVLEKDLELRSALVKGLSKNVAEQVRSFTKFKYDLNWKDTYEKFWFPNVKLNLSSSGHSLNNFRNSTNNNSTLTGQTPELALGLEIGSYNVFNWGIDYLDNTLI
jgi:hypothetical protein